MTRSSQAFNSVFPKTDLGGAFNGMDNHIYIYTYRLVELTEIPKLPYELANIQVEHRESQL